VKRPTTLGTIEFRTRLRERIDAAHANGQHTVITRTDRPLAVLVPHSWHERKTADQPTEEVMEQAVRIVAHAIADYESRPDPQFPLMDNINAFLRDADCWNPDFPDDTNEDY
jgi:antitoxin (DNA-binding transcriptional repressor) of toxin-antitoxin stability system